MRTTPPTKAELKDFNVRRIELTKRHKEIEKTVKAFAKSIRSTVRKLRLDAYQLCNDVYQNAFVYDTDGFIRCPLSEKFRNQVGDLTDVYEHICDIFEDSAC